MITANDITADGALIIAAIGTIGLVSAKLVSVAQQVAGNAADIKNLIDAAKRHDTQIDSLNNQTTAIALATPTPQEKIV